MRRLSITAALLLALTGPVAAQQTLDCAALTNSNAAEPQDYANQCATQPSAAPAPDSNPLAPRAPSDTGFAYNMRGVAGSAQGLYSHVLSTFATQTFRGDPGPNIYALDYDPTGTTLYAIQTITAGTSSLGTINPANGAFTITGTVSGIGTGETPSGLTIDPVTGAAFITSGAAAGTGSLYSFNLSTGAATLIGPHAVGTTGIMIDIAINCDGNMYGHDIGTDSLYSINRTTGAATLIGPHGLLANFAQGMDFDNNDGTLYANIYTGSGTYTYGSFNLTTGAITPLHTNTPSGEWELAIPTTCGPVVPPSETEPNDTKAQANTIQLPGTDRLGVMTGNSISSATTGIDTYLVKTAGQAGGFYRHRLLVTSAIAGHTISIRGLTQATGGVITPGTDIAVQTSSATTTPARFIQWYTSGATADLYVRVTGTAATTADYTLDYEVDPVAPVVGPTGIAPGDVTISTVGQTTVDTDFWVYNGARTAIPTFGNDDEFGTNNSQSVVTRDFDPGVYYLAVTNWNLANDQASPADDDFRTGAVVDFPGVIANSSTTTVTDLDTLIGGTAVTVARAGAFDIQFVRFVVGVYEIEGNDDKATANALLLPPANAPGVVAGSSTAATGAGLDYFRATTAVQTTAGFYRHRLILTSDIAGHTMTVRGLTQTAGVVNAGTDATVQTSSATTTPARFIQWYSTETPADIYIRVAGVAATTADYSLDYTVEPVVPVAGPALTTSPVTITTLGQTTVDTDIWTYDGGRLAIPGYGNDDQFGTTSAQSEFIRPFADGSYTLAVTSYNFANDQPSPADDDFRTGVVLDFPGTLTNSSTSLNQVVNASIGGTVVPLTRAGPFDIAFATFSVSADTIFENGFD